MPSTAQIRAIKTLARKAGLEDDDYRGLLQREAGVNSATKLDDRGAFKVIETLKQLSGGTTAATNARRRATTATGRFGPILQALWIAGYNLGVVRSKDDAALIAFVQRQTKVTHTEFLRDPVQAKRAIEALKDWLRREAGVEWPNDKDDAGGINRKRAVAKAIAERLVATGGFKPFVEHQPAWPLDFIPYGHKCGLPAGFEYYTGEHWDTLCNRLGARLRKTLAEKARDKKAA